MTERAMGQEFTMRKSDAVGVYHKKEQWGKSSPYEKERWAKTSP